MKIIDFETRIIPPELNNYQLRINEANINRLIFDHESFKYSKKYHDLDLFLSTLRNRGVLEICGRPLYWQEYSNQVINNSYLRKLKQDKLIKYAAYGVPLLSNAEILLSVKEDIKSMDWDLIEFIPSWQNYNILEDSYMDVLAFACKNQIPVAIEVGQFFRPPSEIDQAWKILEIAKALPELQIVTPHFGGLLCWYELNEKLQDLMRNVYYVSSCFRTLGWISPILKEISADKLIFGSDFPYIEDVEHEDFYERTREVSVEAQEKFYSKNAESLLTKKSRS